MGGKPCIFTKIAPVTRRFRRLQIHYGLLLVIIKFIRIHTVPMDQAKSKKMVTCPRYLRSLSMLCCNGPYNSSMKTSTRIHNDMRTNLSWRRATGASRRREHGPYFTKFSAGVLFRRSHGVKEKKSRSDGAAHPRFSLEHRPLKYWSRENFMERPGDGATD